MWRSRWWLLPSPDPWMTSVEPAWIGCRPRSRLPRTAVARLHSCCSRLLGSSRRSTYACRATPISMRGPQRSSPAGWRVRAAACWTSPARRRLLPIRLVLGCPCDLLLEGLALVFTDGRRAAVPVLGRAVAAFSSTDVSARGGAPLGLAGVASGEPDLGLRRRSRDRPAGGAARPRLWGARGPRRRGQRMWSGRRGRRRLCEGRAVDGGVGHPQGGDRHPHRPARCACARGSPRPRGLWPPS